ncbi:MAG: GntR family transcriptional regulator [Pseudomonadota bacterium]
MTAPLQQIERRTLHEELVERLRALIVDGRLAPGEKLNEQLISEQFAVSRTPLREAIRSLAAEGLVVLTPRRGATVAELTQADLEESFPVVGALEALAGELACAKITQPEVRRLRELQAQMEAQHRARDLAGYRATNDAIHELIMAAADNPTLSAMHQSLEARVRRARLLANMSDPRWAEAVAEHREILAAVEDRDAPRLSTILKRHLANKLQAIAAQLHK